MAIVKKKMQMGGKAKPVTTKGKPMTGEVGAYGKLKGKDLELEKSNYKKFGDGPGSGPSGAMPKPKMKMGGNMAKQAAIAIAMKKEGKTPKKKMQYGGEAASMKPKGMKKAMMGSSMMKKGGMVKKCKSGCY